MYHDFGIKVFASLKIQKECAIAIEEYEKIQRHVFSVSLSPIDVSFIYYFTPVLQFHLFKQPLS